MSKGYIDYKEKYHIRLWNNAEEVNFPTDHPYWLELIPNCLFNELVGESGEPMCEGLIIKISKSKYEEIKKYCDIENEEE